MATDIPPEEIRPQPEKTFESSRVASSPDGWISTNGVFYPCTPQEHDECADYLLKTQKRFIDHLLIESEHIEMLGERVLHPARTILKTAGFALLSGNQLAESNLPEIRTLKQMEFAERNNLIFTPKSGQLSLEEYQSFLESVKELPGVKKLVERKNVVINNFLDDPTRTIHITDNDSFAKQVFAALSEGSTAEVSVKYSKGTATWRRLNLPDHPDVFLEYEFHDHGYDSTPETESFVWLINKQDIRKYLERMRKAGYYPKGDLDALN